jgi:hypothetical protein
MAAALPGFLTAKGFKRDYSGLAAHKVWKALFTITANTHKEILAIMLFNGYKNNNADVCVDGDAQDTGNPGAATAGLGTNAKKALAMLGLYLRQRAMTLRRPWKPYIARYNLDPATLTLATIDHQRSIKPSTKPVQVWFEYCNTLGATFGVDPNAVWRAFWEQVLILWNTHGAAALTRTDIVADHLLDVIEGEMLGGTFDGTDLPFNNNEAYFHEYPAMGVPAGKKTRNLKRRKSKRKRNSYYY